MAPTFDDLLTAIDDSSCHALELTRRALVFGRSRQSQYDHAANTEETERTAAVAKKELVSALARPTTIDLDRSIRAELRGVMERSVADAGDELRAGLEALLAHTLALALEEALGAHFFDHLAAAGPREIGPDDLIPFVSPFRVNGDPFRAAYDDLAPKPGEPRVRPRLAALVRTHRASCASRRQAALGPDLDDSR